MMQNELKEFKLELHNYLNALRENLASILIVGLIFALLGAMAGLGITKDTYQATASVCSTSYGSIDEASKVLEFISSYSELATSRSVCERAINQSKYTTLEYEDFLKMLTVNAVTSAPVLSISVTSEDPEQAISLANQVASSFLIEIRNTTGGDYYKILDYASEATDAVSTKKMAVVYGVLLGVLGIFLAVTSIIIRLITNKKINTVDSCRLDGELKILGVLPKFQ